MKNNVFSGKPILVYKSGFWYSQIYMGMLSCVMGFNEHDVFKLVPV